LSYFCDQAMSFKLSAADVVANSISALHLVSGVVAPLIRIADFVGNRVKLFQRPLFGGFAHPGELLDVAFHRGFDVLYHLQSAGLAFGAECSLDKNLSQAFARIGAT